MYGIIQIPITLIPTSAAPKLVNALCKKQTKNPKTQSSKFISLRRPI